MNATSTLYPRWFLQPLTAAGLWLAVSLSAQVPGGLDTNFVPATASSDVFWSLAIQPDGKILAAGREGATYGVIDRLTPTGAADPGFMSGARATCLDATIPQINAIALQTNGYVVLAGQFTYIDSFARLRLAQLNTVGSVDTSFIPGAGNSVFAAVVQPDGKIIIGGSFSNFKGSGKNYLARMNSDGSVDASFNTQGSGPQARVTAIALGADGTIVVGGDFTSVNGIARLYVARLLSDGSVDTNFDVSVSGPDATVSAVAIQGDRRVIIGGSFGQVASNVCGRIARLNQDGTLDSSFATGSGCDSAIWAVAVQSNGAILAGGRFNNVNGAVRSKIARFTPTGSLDPTFDPTAGSGAGASDEIRALALQADGKIVVAGKFTTFSGQSRYGIARLYGDTIAAPPLLSAQLLSTNIVLNWTGPFVLQSSSQVAGPYSDVAGVTNPPCSLPIRFPSEFFRLRN